MILLKLSNLNKRYKTEKILCVTAKNLFMYQKIGRMIIFDKKIINYINYFFENFNFLIKIVFFN